MVTISGDCHCLLFAKEGMQGKLYRLDAAVLEAMQNKTYRVKLRIGTCLCSEGQEGEALCMIKR